VVSSTNRGGEQVKRIRIWFYNSKAIFKLQIPTMTETYNKPPETILFWKCKQRKGKKTKCNYINKKENMNCHSCNTKRDTGDVALDKYNHTIGMLKKVEGVLEHWEHYELDDEVREGETGVTSGGGS